MSTTQHVNGEEPAPAAPAAAQAQRPSVEGVLVTPVTVMLNGITATFGAMVPFDALMVALSRVLGSLVGSAIRGNLSAVLKCRAECKEAFVTALTAAKLEPIEHQPAPPRPGEG